MTLTLPATPRRQERSRRKLPLQLPADPHRPMLGVAQAGPVQIRKVEVRPGNPTEQAFRQDKALNPEWTWALLGRTARFASPGTLEEMLGELGQNMPFDH